MAPPAQDPNGIKKQLMTSPVKLACLACRASRTRCDGSHPCANCKNRERECIYKPSRRGGARIRKKSLAPDNATRHTQFLSVELEEASQHSTDTRNFIGPGAGLRQLQDIPQDSDIIFDAIFAAAIPEAGSGNPGSSPTFGFLNPGVPVVRTYESDQAILDAYYIFIHPYFPILPPPITTPIDQAVPHFQNDIDSFEDKFEPSTPLSLAISAILALIPSEYDTNHTDKQSVLFRRRYAQYLVQCAIESMEIESEIPDSSIEPSKALGETPGESLNRQQLHPHVSPEMESIIALDMLSVYEYAQRGNLKKMQTRASQALMAAMAISLHSCTEDNEICEAKRRVWWMTYVCVCQCAIVSNTEPSFTVFGPSFISKHPVLKCDSEAFSVFIQAQQAILAATQFVTELKKAVKNGTDMTRIYERMKAMESHLEALNKIADTWTLQATSTSPIDPSEVVVSRSLRCMSRIKLNSARIKIHRYCAFFDEPVFPSKHCDLKAKSDEEQNGAEHNHLPSCSCGTMFSSVSPSSGESSSASPPAVLLTTPPYSDREDNTSAVSPFNSHESAKICLKSALKIAQAFDDLPYPNPTGQECPTPCYLSQASNIVCPRTMPSFACCAMQCAYALLMVSHKTRSKYSDEAPVTPMAEALLVRLRAGLESISTTLDNYAVAFEALGGMRDQIRSFINPTEIAGATRGD